MHINSPLNTNGHRQVLEIKPKGIFDDSLRILLEQYFMLHNIEFKVISNESIFSQLLEALPKLAH
ncbi:hypothetical protein [Microbulbifer epialgicus]|uniref:Uncharacterized protein n=1 Tax=Microbulbifer epialgicus TaxID=393907 RepID=A0ABV4P4N0_9GAMM